VYLISVWLAQGAFDQRSIERILGSLAAKLSTQVQLSTGGARSLAFSRAVKQGRSMARPQRLPEDCRDALAAGRGLLTTASLRNAGVSSRQLARLLDRNVMIGVAKGVYADAAAYRALEPWPRFALRTRAFVAASPPDAIAADWSAVALHRLPATREPPSVPSVIRPTPRRSGSNRTCHGRTRYAAVRDRWIAQIDDVAVFAPAMAAVDLARHVEQWRALALADAAANKAGSNGSLMTVLNDMSLWPGIARARWSVEHADPDAESPLESAGRCAFIHAHLPIPLSNVWVGERYPLFRLDHYWVEQRLAAEADGMGKYLIGDNAAAVLRREKDRELWLEAHGIRVIRYTWALATRYPQVLAERCRERLSEPMTPARGEIRWWPSRTGSAMLRGVP